MKLIEILPAAPAALTAVEISLITQDSREARAGTIFFALEGSQRDGHDFVPDVVVKGAVAVVRRDHARTLNLADRSRIIEVDDTRKSYGEAASRFQDQPSQRLLICGVTGTNGKTTSTYLLEALLTSWGRKPAVIGTVENRFGSYRLESAHTTPDARSLQKIFSDFASRGADAICMEVSSHALDQQRVWGTRFEAALFTNLTQDHLDYHSDMDDYFRAKAGLFLDYPLKIRAIHHDDPYGKRLAALCKSNGREVLTFGGLGCNVNYGGLRVSADGIEGELAVSAGGRDFSITVRSPMIGAFNVQNLAGAVTVAIGLGIPPETISAALANAGQVPGRMEKVPNTHGLTVVVDYAHTPDALEKALTALKQLGPKRLLCVFGCGGDRDAGKRPLMGAIAERLADVVFVTSDNPRTENPDQIIEMIMVGLKDPARARRINDRQAAIAQAISILREKDILLIAGKGHEDYQIIGTQKLPFDDRLVAQENLRNG
ncbi:MAG: UDP-N-acetylmuramoyl-L-alanyl-D-glutamate--2,6-diaminopimelate ligase [Deltaproteobacteria bacterium]|nr:UDP-N-acetylmuramoyl-L-alanyl-D-glutamate--2,6-diaminopimelate ligase [Deltaproteobacteria bacterium]